VQFNNVCVEPVEESGVKFPYSTILLLVDFSSLISVEVDHHNVASIKDRVQRAPESQIQD